MVKGVKRNIIEIKNTGSDCFERIVFYISPDFPLAGKNAADLAAVELKRIVNGSSGYKNTLRYRVRAKRRRRFILCVSGLFMVALAVVLLILKK
ncbi:MAG: hypothetical protein IKI68_04095 [Clostridia bacterium]|nr:hypothetical protein [Clostridia bacterium]